MTPKFPNQLYAVVGLDGRVAYHGELVNALMGSTTGRAVAVYALQKVRSGKLIAEWDPEPAPVVAPQPIREDL